MKMGVTSRHNWPWWISGRVLFHSMKLPVSVKLLMNRRMMAWGSLPSLEKIATRTLTAISPKVNGPNP